MSLMIWGQKNIHLFNTYFLGFLGGSVIKNPSANARCGFDPSQDEPLEKEMVPTLVFLLGEFHRQRSLESYSPWGCKRV